VRVSRLLLALSISYVAFMGAISAQQPALRVDPPAAAPAPAPAPPARGYVGSQACRRCHTA